MPGDPRWRFSILPACSFHVIFVAAVHSRGTRIFQQQNYQDRQRAPLVIKGACVRKSGHNEAEMLQRLHSTGTLQGCLRAIELEPGPSAHTPHWPEQEARQKQRLLCFDTGETVVQSRSVFQFLEAIPDSLEREQFFARCVHTWAVLIESLKVHRAALNRGVLHRDVSPGNVYINPLHVHIDGCTDLQGVDIPTWYRAPVSEPLKFISRILDRP